MIFWAGIIVSPWQPWRTRESWDSVDEEDEEHDLSDITVLIPARNEEKILRKTLPTVVNQGRGLKIFMVDDRSEDDTAKEAERIAREKLTLIKSEPLPAGWSGKLWALEQARKHTTTPYTVLLDADIQLDENVIYGLKEKMLKEKKDFVSLMAAPRLASFWEKILMPAFVYFFKLLYPFQISNSNSKLIAAAAGGCIIMRSEILNRIGGFASIKDALIDDCKLARKVKDAGFKTWLGLTHSVNSIRSYKELGEIWNMVARTAYSQLFYSFWILLLCTIILIVAFIIPVIFIFHADQTIFYISVTTMALMFISYFPTLTYYEKSPYWALLMPVIGLMYLLMTWTSAIRYWGGERMRWRGRIIAKGNENKKEHFSSQEMN